MRELKVGFGANFIGALLSALLPGGYELNAENFVQLDPNNSYLSLFYGKGEGDQRDIRIDLALAADPAMIGLSLFGIKAAVNDEYATVVPEGVDLDEFKSIFADDGAISLSAAIGLELKLKGTDSLPDGELPVGDMPLGVHRESRTQSRSQDRGRHFPRRGDLRPRQHLL